MNLDDRETNSLNEKNFKKLSDFLGKDVKDNNLNSIEPLPESERPRKDGPGGN